MAKAIDSSDSIKHTAHSDSDSDSDSDSTLISNSSLSQSTTLCGSSPRDNEKVNIKETMDGETDMESLPEYSKYDASKSKTTSSGAEKDPLLADGSSTCDYYAEQQQQPQQRCSRRGWLGRRCRRMSASTSRCERSHQLRKRVAWIALFVKVVLIFGLLAFLTRRVCMKHRKGSKLPDFSDHSWGKMQSGEQQREIVLNPGSQPVVGRYPLYDLLHIKTSSGSVNIQVDPQPADPKKPDEPARLVIETQAGAVSVTFLESKIDTMATFENGDTKKVSDVIDLDYLKTSGATSITQIQGSIPYRPYQIEVRSQSGDITGEFLFTSFAHLKTQSGRIAAHFTPVISHDHEESVVHHTVLTTETESGAQDISLAEPLVIDDSAGRMYPAGAGLAFASTAASHSSQSGNIAAKYPRSWAGRVEASTSSGWIALGGRGLNVTEQERGHAVGVKYPDHDDSHAHHQQQHHNSNNYEDGDGGAMMKRKNQNTEWWGGRGDMSVNLESTGSGSIQFHVKDRFLPHSVDEPDDF